MPISHVLHRIDVNKRQCIEFTPSTTFRCTHILLWSKAIESVSINSIIIGTFEELCMPIPGILLACEEQFEKLQMLSSYHLNLYLNAKHPILNLSSSLPTNPIKISFSGVIDTIGLFGKVMISS